PVAAEAVEGGLHARERARGVGLAGGGEGGLERVGARRVPDAGPLALGALAVGDGDAAGDQGSDGERDAADDQAPRRVAPERGQERLHRRVAVAWLEG